MLNFQLSPDVIYFAPMFCKGCLRLNAEFNLEKNVMYFILMNYYTYLKVEVDIVQLNMENAKDLLLITRFSISLRMLDQLIKKKS